MFIWRVFRRLLAQIIRLLLLNRAVTLGLLGVLIVAFVVVPLMAAAGTLPGGVSQSGVLSNGQPVQAAAANESTSTSTAANSAALPPDPAVQTYIRGMMAFDANT